MADDDEDLSHLRTMNLDPAADEDGEETLDYGAAFAKIAYETSRSTVVQLRIAMSSWFAARQE